MTRPDTYDTGYRDGRDDGGARVAEQAKNMEARLCDDLAAAHAKIATLTQERDAARAALLDGMRCKTCVYCAHGCGSYQADPAGTLVQWTDGVRVCIFYGGEAKTFFRSRNATQYLAKEALKKGLQRVSQGTAAKLVGAGKALAGPSGSVLLGAIQQAAFSCKWLYPRTGKPYLSCPKDF